MGVLVVNCGYYTTRNAMQTSCKFSLDFAGSMQVCHQDKSSLLPLSCCIKFVKIRLVAT